MAEENLNAKPELETADTDEPLEVFCKTQMIAIENLKVGTKRLLRMIEEIEKKTDTKKAVKNAFAGDSLKPITLTCISSGTCTEACPEFVPLKALEEEIEKIEIIQTEQDDCSVYKKLTRKCHCLTRPEYNDFVIHFNQDTKFSTSTLGEIIKNVRTLKRFLYIGNGYTKNALMFLNEGLTKSPLGEKVDIILACSHADLCSIFEDQTFVKTCILGSFKYESFGDHITQNLAARVLYRMAIIEEGRRYLNFNSKTTTSLKSILQNRVKELDVDTAEFIRSTISLLNPSPSPVLTNHTASCYCKADEGTANQVLSSLINFRSHMTMDEVVKSLEVVLNISASDLGKKELGPSIITVFILFKQLVLEYDNFEINNIIARTIRNIMKRPLNSQSDNKNLNLFSHFKTYVVSDTATEPVHVKDESMQIPLRKYLSKYKNKPNKNLRSIRSKRFVESEVRLTNATIINKSTLLTRSVNRSITKGMDMDRLAEIDWKSKIVVQLQKNYLKQQF